MKNEVSKYRNKCLNVETVFRSTKPVNSKLGSLTLIKIYR